MPRRDLRIRRAINSATFDRGAMRQNLMFGTPDQVIAKLTPCEALGVDQFVYCASFGLAVKRQKRSLKLFIKEVMPSLLLTIFAGFR